MNKRKIIFLFGFLVIIVLVVGVVLLKNKNDDSPLYVIKAHDGGTPGNLYVMSFYENKKIVVEQRRGCSAVECMNGKIKLESTITNIEFSSESIDKIYIWLDTFIDNNNAKLKDKTIEIEMLNMPEVDKQYLESLAYNREEGIK